MSVKSAADAGITTQGKRGPYRRRKLQTFADVWASGLEQIATEARTIRWPNVRADLDPVWFFRDILGVEPWGRQTEAIIATTEHPRVAISSGHKTGKSYLVGGLALSKYCAYDDSRVVLTSTTSRQVDAILWRQIRQLIHGSGVCLACKREGYKLEDRPCPHSAVIDGQIGDLARTGLKSGFREVVGFTAREPEAVAGISGAHLWYFTDEASGIPEVIFEAIEGNRAGGARIVMTSNPTKTEGTFFDAFYTRKDSWKAITISSEETPNCTIAPGTIPGLADPEWIAEKEQEWGRESAFFRVRVLGEFPVNEDGKIFSIALISEAQQRWYETPHPKPSLDVEALEDNRLFVGCDPAGATGTGDETAIATRRGNKILTLERARGLNIDAHVARLLGVLNKLRWPGELPVLAIDRDGKIGSELYGALRSLEQRNPALFELHAVRGSDGAKRKPQVFDRTRDELASNLEDWLVNGGTLPPDVKLEQELHTLEWETAINGKTKLLRKTKIREIIGRSPDSYDAVSIVCWVPAGITPQVEPAKEAPPSPDVELGPGGAFDPYSPDAIIHAY
jgi:hypothetical protein